MSTECPKWKQFICYDILLTFIGQLLVFRYFDVMSDNTEGGMPITGVLHTTFHAVTLAHTEVCELASRKNTRSSCGLWQWQV